MGARRRGGSAAAGGPAAGPVPGGNLAATKRPSRLQRREVGGDRALPGGGGGMARPPVAAGPVRRRHRVVRGRGSEGDGEASSSRTAIPGWSHSSFAWLRHVLRDRRVVDFVSGSTCTRVWISTAANRFWSDVTGHPHRPVPPALPGVADPIDPPGQASDGLSVGVVYACRRTPPYGVGPRRRALLSSTVPIRGSSAGRAAAC